MTTRAGDSESIANRTKATFRPDVEGMRAVAVVLVLLYHAFGAPFTGGFVGVDVFFVISGFVITDVLLRERSDRGRISIPGFYARRVRRILPAATLVIVSTVAAAYRWLGFIAGNQIAEDGKWAAAFVANIRFALLGTDYFGEQLPPSPLQHMWSLGVEEQFYVVWPALFLVMVLVGRGLRDRGALAVVLAIAMAASFAWSLVQTPANPTWAYFSPLTRAWELALGALIAVSGPAVGRISSGRLWQSLAAVGLIGIVTSLFLVDAGMQFPGYVVALPVVSSGLLILAGCGNPGTWVGRALAIRPMQWIGARSYSLYLWHWPPLVIAAEHLGRPLSAVQAGGLLAAALTATALTYRYVENPIRRSRFLAARTGLTLAFGMVLIGGTVIIAQWLIATHYGTWDFLANL